MDGVQNFELIETLQLFEPETHSVPESKSNKGFGNVNDDNTLLWNSGVVESDIRLDDFLTSLNQPSNAGDAFNMHPLTLGESHVLDLQEDQEAMELVGELYREDTGHSTCQRSQPEVHGWPPSLRPQVLLPMSSIERVQPLSLELSLSTPTLSHDGDEALTLPFNRQAEIDLMANYIKAVVERSCSIKPEDMSSKLKVHEVILVILLNATHGVKSKDLRRILAFCDEDGREVSGESRHFKTLDTETMGVLWRKIKRNRMASYDTFARAMRVRREKSNGYFEYLETGLRSKKRVYRFGEKAMEDMARIKRTLKQFSEQHTFGSGFC